MNNVGKTIGSLFSAFLVWLVYYLALPTLSIAYMDGFWFFAFIAFMITVNIWIWASDFECGDFVCWPMGVVVVVAIVLFLGGKIIGSTLFNAERMHQQLGVVEIIEYDDMIKTIDNSQIPIVDDALAQKLADKKLGEDVALGSRVYLGDAKIQEVGEEIMYVVPLQHSGFFKWNKYKTTPGYITVSATNQNKIDYVTSVGDEKIDVLYEEGAYFKYDIKRHIRNEGYRNVGLTEFTFELNDEGLPYWVVTTYENTTIWGNSEATGVVIVDAQTGKTSWHSVEEVPAWVDIVQPDKFVEKQINNWGTLVHGVFNWSNADKIRKTARTLTVYAEGECYYFTGMTSVGSDESCVGFIMVNTRSKKSNMCYMTGATEDAAMRSAEGIVSDFGYISTEPLPLNVNGIPTYVMALKDGEGLVKSYAMVNIELYNIVAKGETLAEVARSYIQKVAKSGQNNVVASDEAYSYTIEGIVSRISSVVEDGSTYFYIIIEGEENKIFTASYITSEELSVTRDGDIVVIKYIDDRNGTVDIIEFDNTLYGVSISEDQQNRNELDEESSALDNEYNQIIEVYEDMTEDIWNSLTPEEKAKLIASLGND